MTDAPRPVPHPNCYWVPGSAILAGEYPGSIRGPEVAAKLRLLVGAGVGTFIDLTEDDELRPYTSHLAEGVRHVRMPVRDMDVPDEASMHRILDFLDAELAAGRAVYLHCWGGVGRTGTVVGCHLVRRGHTGDEALDAIERLWRSIEKRTRHPRSPETDTQRHFVRRWPAAERRRRADRVRGCLLGGAVGDALGAPVEFLGLDEIRARYGPDGIADFVTAYGRLGAITDDTQMTLFTAEGLLRAASRGRQKGIVDVPSVVHHAYLRWLHTQGDPYDRPGGQLDGWLVGLPDLHHTRAPGFTCLGALQTGRAGSMDAPLNDSKGCGGVMRAAPAGLVDTGDPFRLGCEIAVLTHGHPSGYLAAGCQAALVAALVKGQELEPALDAVRAELRRYPRHEECLAALDGAIAAASRAGPPSAETIESLAQGWVAEEALAIAVYCALAARGDFALGVRLAVNHGGDSDSTGAITGSILGAMLGVGAIPASWLGRLELRDEIEALADDLVTLFRDDEEWWARYPGW